jgi:tetratricopeptide (TPR) repeat protein
MRLDPAVKASLQRAHTAFERGADREALAELEHASEAAVAAGELEQELAVRLAALTVRAEVDGAATTLLPLAELAERARAADLQPLYAAIVLERAEELRKSGRHAEAAEHAQTLAEWGRRTGWPELVGAAALSLGLSFRAVGRLAEANTVFNGGLWELAAKSQKPPAPASPLLPAVPEAAQTLRALTLQHARTALDLGLYFRARECLNQAAGFSLPTSGRVFAALIAVDLAPYENRPPDLEPLRAALSELEQGRPSAFLAAQLGRLAALDEDPLRAAAALERAERIAAQLDAVTRAEVALARATVHFRRGELRQAEEALPDPASLPAESPVLIDRQLAAAALQLTEGQPRKALEPVIAAVGFAESLGDELRAATAHRLAVTLFRQLGMVREAAAHRGRAAELYHKVGLGKGLGELEVERAWEALIASRLGEAEAALLPLDELSDLDLLAQVALCRGACALRAAEPGRALPALLTVHARLVAQGPRVTAVPLARAIRSLAKAAALPIPDAVRETLAWAEHHDIPATDPLFIPNATSAPN